MSKTSRACKDFNSLLKFQLGDKLKDGLQRREVKVVERGRKVEAMTSGGVRVRQANSLLDTLPVSSFA